MKILEQTPQRLSLRDRAISLWAVATGLILGGLLVIGQGQMITFNCRRNLSEQSQCYLSKFGTLGIGSSQQSINSLRGAMVDSHRSSKGRWTYWVVLVTDEGNLRLTHSSSSNQYEHEAIADQINAFVINPKAQSLQIQQDDRVWLLLFGGLLLGLGAIFVIVVCRVTYCDLDRTTGKLRIARWGFRGMNVHEYPLHQIASANLDTRIEKYKGQLRTTYRITFRLLSGKQIPLNQFYAQDRLRAKAAYALSSFLATRPAVIEEAIEPQLDEAERLYRLGMEQYRQQQMQEAGTNLKQARDLFDKQHNTQRVMEIQTLLWQLGLA